MKGELEELGEEVDDSVDSISKVQTQILNLTHGSVNIFDSNGDFRDYYEIMRDIADVYDQLSSTDQASLDEILFGKQRANQGAALIQSFKSGQVEKALNASINSEGSAQQELDRWNESIEAALGRLSASWQTFSNDILNGDLIKFVVNFGNEFLKVIDSITNSIGSIPTAIAGAGIVATIKSLV